MSLEVRRITAAEESQWDVMVAEASGNCLYLQSTWAHLVNQYYGSGEFLRLGIFAGDQLVGGMAGLSRQRLKQETLVMPLMTQYGGPVVAVGREDSGEILEALLKHLDDIGLVHVIGYPGFSDCNPFAMHGYSVGLRQTYYLDISGDLDQVWAGFESNVHRNIRKAERADFELREGLINVDEGAALFEAPFLRRGSPSGVGGEFLKQIVSGIDLADRRWVLAAYQGEKLVSYICWLRSGRMAYYAVATTDPDALPTGVSSLLIWQSIQKLQADGVEVIDFLGANIPSIAAFKARFGCELVTYPVFRKVKSKRLAAALSMKSLLSKGFSWRRNE